MHHRLSSPFFSSAAVNSFPRLFLPSVLGPSLHPSASASTRDAPICHLPFACCFRGALRINHAQYLVFPQSTLSQWQLVPPHAVAPLRRQCEKTHQSPSHHPPASRCPPPINQHAVQYRWDTALRVLGHWTGPTWTIPSHRAPGHQHASAAAVPLPVVARRTLAILSSLRPSRPRSTRSRPGLPPLNTIRTACVPTRCRRPHLATLHSTSSSLTAPTRSPSRMG